MKQVFTNRVVAAVEAGEISPAMACACLTINEHADENGVWIGNATRLYNLLGGQIALTNVQRMLKTLYNKNFLKSLRTKASGSFYPIVVVYTSGVAIADAFAPTSEVISPVIIPEIVEPTIEPVSTVTNEITDALKKFRISPESAAKLNEALKKYTDVEIGQGLALFIQCNPTGHNPIAGFATEAGLWIEAALSGVEADDLEGFTDDSLNFPDAVSTK